MARQQINIFEICDVVLFLFVATLLFVSACEKVPGGGIEKSPGYSKDNQIAVAFENDKDYAKENRKVRFMSSQQIVELIKQKDWDIIEEPGKVGADVAPVILPLLDHEDSEVRELAVHCLNEAGGRAARQGFLKALGDSDDMVWAAACRYLQTNYDKEDLEVLTKQLSSNENEYIREHVALVIGRIGDPGSVRMLQTQLQIEKDADAGHAISIALTRLGESKNRQAYIERLRQDDPKQRVLALRDFEYISDKTLLPNIRLLLDDTRDAVNVAPGDHRYYIRVCDVAVNVLDVVLDHPFVFNVDQLRRYSAQELIQAKSVISNYK